jgi:hypothetical protein
MHLVGLTVGIFWEVFNSHSIDKYLPKFVSLAPVCIKNFNSFLHFFNIGQQVSQISSGGVVTMHWAGCVKDHPFFSVSKRLISSQRHPQQFLGPASHLMDTMGTFPNTKAVDAGS